jgi:cytochrome c-type biogenesis protein CcmH/NrfF
VASLVWALPVVAVVVALFALGVAFRRWRARPGVEVSDEDRALVERELQREDA